MVVCPACNSRYEEGISFCPRDGTHVVGEPSRDEVGKVLADRYRIMRKLGEGGMGEVYEAAHIYIEKRFALKLLRKEIMTNHEAVTRFSQEARAASAIGHENIVEIDDFGHLPDGRAYLAMEYLEGQSLADAARSPMDLARALDIVFQVGKGLAAAHAKGIIHRDMKPENVFLSMRSGGRELVKILDFGIAKVSGTDQGRGNLTRTGTIFGTPHYMSPEQALGKPLDHRTDIYSVGVIMYEIFTGAVPFRGESFMAILTQHITAAPMPPHQVAPERQIPESVEQVILRAMAKEPSERYPTMAAMLDDLGEVWREIFGASRPATVPPGSSTLGAPSYGGRSGAVRAAAGGQGSGPARAATPIGQRSGGPARGLRTPVSSSQERGRPPSGGTRKPTPAELAVATTAAASDPLHATLPAIRSSMAQHRTPGDDEEGLEPLPSRSRAPVIAATALVVLAGAAGAYYYFGIVRARTRSAPVVMPAPSPAPPTPVVVTPPAPELAPPAPAPAGPHIVSVLLDSVPPGAAIIRDGKHFSDTPEQIDVADGTTLMVELHRDGYRDLAVMLDPQRGRKLVVRLQRARRGEAHHHAAMPPPPLRPKRVPPPHLAGPAPGPAPAPGPDVGPVTAPAPSPVAPDPTAPVPPTVPPTVIAPPPVTGPVVVPPAPLEPGRKRKKDPYERLDKAEEPIDPYR